MIHFHFKAQSRNRICPMVKITHPKNVRRLLPSRIFTKDKRKCHRQFASVQAYRGRLLCSVTGGDASFTHQYAWGINKSPVTLSRNKPVKEGGGGVSGGRCSSAVTYKEPIRKPQLLAQPSKCEKKLLGDENPFQWQFRPMEEKKLSRALLAWICTANLIAVTQCRPLPCACKRPF